MANKASLIFHGHFYQPPRENPWLGVIEQQDSASPFHDWNERITYECYAPMTMARVINEEGRVEKIINNLKFMSFNYGPTLFSWLENKQPELIQAIVEADKDSVRKHKGHGNAIAQGYNHIILPLATDRDCITQIRWGLREFEFRYGRKSESIWLPETACSHRTIEILINEGIKFIILSPHQAEKFRKLNSENWQDVSNGTIDPSRAYRQYHPKNKDKFIDIFFYDGPVSKSLGFDDVLQRSSKDFMDKIETAYTPSRHHYQLVHTAIDGETYGHHKAFAERVLAYALITEAENRGYKITNYGEFLEEHPPEFEVMIKKGEGEEGTSWSCAHGVGRWKDNCGCHTGGGLGWNQKWRKPLREALDYLRNELLEIFEKSGDHYFKDVWDTRNDYIEVILKKNDSAVEEFFYKHEKFSLSDAEKVQALKLMEMQKNALLMYTSCGWFFNDISGIETVQILKYAAKALSIAKEFTEINIENEFLQILEKAQSNIAELKNGRVIYDRFVKPSIITYEKVVNHYAIMMLFNDISHSSIHFNYEIVRHEYKEEKYGELTMAMGQLEIKDISTREVKALYYSLLRSGPYDYRCSVKPFTSKDEYLKLKETIFEKLQKDHIVEIFRLIDKHFGLDYYTIQDLFLEERRRLLEILTKETLSSFSSTYIELYEQNRRAVDIFRQAGLNVPEEFKISAQYTINKKLEDELCDIREPVGETWGGSAIPYLKMSEEWGFKPDLSKVTNYLGDWIATHINDLYSSDVKDIAKKTKNIENIIKSIKRLKIAARLTNAQDVFYKVIICKKLQSLFSEFESDNKSKKTSQALESLIRLGLELGFNMNKSLSKFRSISTS